MKKFLFFSFIIISVFSCVDKDYDLNKDISTEMELFSDGVSLPIGYTDQLKLDSLIKDVDYLYIDPNGNYYLSILDSFSADVPEFDRSRLKIDGQRHSNILDNPEEASSSFSKKFPGKSSFENIMYIYKDTFDIEFSEPIAEEILAFKTLNFKNPVSITISISLDNVPAFFQNQDINIAFKSQIPDIIKLDSPHNNNVFSFNGKIKGNGSLRETATFKKFEKEIIIENGVFDYADVLVTEISLGVTELSGNPSPADTLNFKNIKINFEVAISDMEIQSVIGRMNFQIGPESNHIDMSDFANAIGNGQNNVFDLTRADILFTIHKDVDASFLTSLGLTPMKNGSSSSSPQSVSLNIDEQENKFFISNDLSNAPSGYETHSLDIPGILKSVPDEVDAAWDAQTDINKYFFLDLYETYSVKGNYNINIPLSFGGEFHVSLKDTIDFDLDDDVLDIFFKTGTVELVGKIKSIFPLSIKLHLDGIDYSGNKIAGLHYEVEVPSSSFSIKVESNKLELLKETQLWEVTFDVRVGNSQTGIIINKNDYIQLLDFKLHKKEGIIINDIDDLNL